MKVKSGLSASQRARFAAEGWVGPFPLMSAEAAHALDDAIEPNRSRFTYPNDFDDPARFRRRPWFKTMATYLPEVFAVTRAPEIADRVAALVGPDVMAWGVTVIEKRPGERHPWHIDIEHAAWPGVSAFLGLSGTGADATLDVISGSHRVTRFPLAIGWDSDEAALTAARAQNPSCTLHRVAINDGEFFLFDGRLWHGSRNESGRVRRALIAQYSTPRHRVAIPLNFTPPIRWHPEPPPCVLVAGLGEGPNRVIDAPLPLPT